MGWSATQPKHIFFPIQNLLLMMPPTHKVNFFFRVVWCFIVINALCVAFLGSTTFFLWFVLQWGLIGYYQYWISIINFNKKYNHYMRNGAIIVLDQSYCNSSHNMINVSDMIIERSKPYIRKSYSNTWPSKIFLIFVNKNSLQISNLFSNKIMVKSWLIIERKIGRFNCC